MRTRATVLETRGQWPYRPASTNKLMLRWGYKLKTIHLEVSEAVILRIFISQWYGPFWQPPRSLQPPNSLWRASLTSYFKSVTPITYLFMCILLIWCGPFWQPLRPPQPPKSLRDHIWPHIWNQWPQLPTYSYCLLGMGPFVSLRGHPSLQTVSEVKCNLSFEISDPNYLLVHVHIAYMVWGLLAASEATTASKQPWRSNQTSHLKSVTPITYVPTSL